MYTMRMEYGSLDYCDLDTLEQVLLKQYSSKIGTRNHHATKFNRYFKNHLTCRRHFKGNQTLELKS